jgi:hypothetical protein
LADEADLIMFCSFSSGCRSATSAAARSGGDAVVSHTLVVANGPLTQSGNSVRFGVDCASTTPEIDRRIWADTVNNKLEDTILASVAFHGIARFQNLQEGKLRGRGHS